MSTLIRPCARCPGELPAGAAFCPACGTPASGAFVPTLRRAPASDARGRLQRALGDGWEVRWLVGRGGFAEVYAAWDSQLKRQVAVKTLRQELAASEPVRERFRREAETVAQLRHPNVVPIYAVGEAEGLVYFVMPLIEGESLAAALKREHVLPVAESVRMLQEAAGALHTAHRAGVVHRDVKPENLMLEGADRRVVVMDFGIAMIADGADVRLTNTGFVMGSPHFMSPEQAAGERDVDHRSDQYALAAVAFEMLTGRLPFVADSFQGYLFQQATQEAPRVDALRSDVPPALADAIARGLARNPAQRHASMEAFAQALGAAVAAGTPDGVRRRVQDRAMRLASATAALHRWRRPALAAAAIGVALLAAFGDALSPAGGVRTASRRDASEQAGRAALVAAGAPRDLPTRVELVQRDSALRWLADAVGSATAASRAEREGIAWGWRVTAYDAARGEIWQTVVSTGGRVTVLSRTLADTSTAWGARLSPAAASALAERTLAERGWRPTALRPAAATGGGPRGDHAFAWHVRGSAVRNAAGDSAVRRVAVAVRGGRVSEYRESLDLPTRAPNAWVEAKSAAIVGLAVVLFALATAVAVRRTRVDDVQWGVGLRLALPAAATLAVVFGHTLYLDATVPTTLDPDEWTSSLIGFVISMPVIGLVAAGALAAAESLTHDRMPQLFAGAVDAARGRLDGPELSLGTLVGTALGVLGAGAQAATFQAGRATGEWLGAVPDAFDLTLPVLGLLPAVLGATLYVTAIAVGFALVVHRGWPPAVVVAAVAAGAALAMLPVEQPLSAAFRVVWLTALAGVVWRAGVHAGMTAVFLYGGLPVALALLRAETPAFALWGAFALLVLAAPAALATVAARKIAR